MSQRSFLVSAPSNIAIIKYMGKADLASNLPTNGSLSMTLNSLCTRLQVTLTTGERKVPHESIEISVTGPNELSEKGKEKFIRFAKRALPEIEEIFSSILISVSFPEKIEIISQNTFPAGVGIASSASSFAALTAALAFSSAADSAFFLDQFSSNLNFRKKLASLSRKGSGSSCRSFFAPWVFWTGEEVSEVPHHFPDLTDIVCVVSAIEKEVSSSEAHARVLSSPHWNGRVDRANLRVNELKTALATGDLNHFSQLAQDDSTDMHTLFHTSQPSFTYSNEQTLALLAYFDQKKESLPFFALTQDAGPNLHLLVKSEEVSFFIELLKKDFPKLILLVDRKNPNVSPDPIQFTPVSKN